MMVMLVFIYSMIAVGFLLLGWAESFCGDCFAFRTVIGNWLIFEMKVWSVVADRVYFRSSFSAAPALTVVVPA